MEDAILDSEELDFESKDAQVAYVKDGLIHKHIIPILLSPKVIFPFQITRPIIGDSRLKSLFRQAHEKKTVFGYVYHPADAEEKLPAIGQIGTSASITTLEKTTNGSYLVEIAPINRFFIDEYITTDKADLTARVKYYWDHPEDDALIKSLELEYKKLLTQIGELTKTKTFKNIAYENDLVMLNFYLYTFFRDSPFIDEPTKLHLLWMHKLSERLTYSINMLEEMLPKVRRAVSRMVPYKNN